MKRLFAVLLLLLLCASAWAQPDARPGPYALTLAKWKAILTGTKTASYIVDGSGAARLLTAADIPAHNASAANLTSGAIASAARLSTSGTADSTTFLRGDLTWATPAGGSSNISLSNITSGTLATTLALGTNAVTGTYLQAGGSGYSILRAGTTGTVLQNAGGTVNWLVWTDSTNTMAIGTGTAGQAQLTCSPTNFSARSGSTYLALTNAAGSINSLLWTDASSTWALDSTCTLNIAGNLAFTGAGKLLAPTSSPTSSGTGTTGQITWDSSYIYVCTATNTWKRAALTGGY